MEIWQTILLALGGNVILLAVLGWLSKSFVSQLLAKDIEAFKSSLKSESDLAVQKLKYDIDKSKIEYELKLSKLHEKRADVIADTYGLLVQCYREVSNLIYPADSGKMSDVEKNYKTAMSSVINFFSQFNKQRIYLPEDLCSEIDDFLMELRFHAIVYYDSIKRDDRYTRKGVKEDGVQESINDAVVKARNFIDQDSKVTKALLEKKLRELMEEVEKVS